MFCDACHSFFLLPLLCVSTAFSPVIAAQDPIRVESDQVLVPAVVLNDKLYSQLSTAQFEPNQRNTQLMEKLVIHGLSTKDFRLFEYGQQQIVQSVALESPGFALVRDNSGKHPEIIGTGGGRWSYPDRPSSDSSQWLAWPQYVIAYIPPPSPVGSCHKIQVKVNRSHVVVWAGGEYCNTKHPAPDPLNGTEFGKQMEADLASTTQSKIDLTLQAIPFYGDTGRPPRLHRIRVSLEIDQLRIQKWHDVRLHRHTAPCL